MLFYPDSGRRPSLVSPRNYRAQRWRRRCTMDVGRGVGVVIRVTIPKDTVLYVQWTGIALGVGGTGKRTLNPY